MVGSQKQEDVFLPKVLVEVIQQFGHCPIKAKVSVLHFNGGRPKLMSYSISCRKRHGQHVLGVSASKLLPFYRGDCHFYQYIIVEGGGGNYTQALSFCYFWQVMGEYRSSFPLKHVFIGVVIRHTFDVLFYGKQRLPRLQVFFRHISGIDRKSVV